jgi:Flp pilus assembly protein TadD
MLGAGATGGQHPAGTADLPLPEISPQLHPQYRTLLEESLRVTTQLVEAFPADAQAVAALALLHNLAHDEAGEAACWQRCLELEGAGPQAYEHLARRAADRGDYQRAEALAREALAENPAQTVLVSLLAEALMSQGRLEESVRLLEDHAAAHPSPPAIFVLLGQLYLQRQEYRSAKAQFEKALMLNFHSAPAHLGLATACARLGDAAGAARHRAEFERLNRQEDQAARAGLETMSDENVVPPCVAQIMVIAGNVYFAHGQSERAEKRLLRAAELDPANTACRQMLAEIYSQFGRLEDAAQIVEQLRDLEPWNLAHRKNLGILQARMNRTDAAEATFREVCAIAPDKSLGYAGLAELFLRADVHLSEARELAAAAVRLEPTAWHYFILGAICEQEGDEAAARAALERAAALEPDNPRYKTFDEATRRKP